MPKIQWLGERETTAEAGLAAQSGTSDQETRTATDEATEWLRAYLADGPRPADEVTAEAVTARIIPDDKHDKPLRSARARLGITIKDGTIYREGGIAGDGQWMWRYVASAPSTGHLSENGAGEHGASPGTSGAAAKVPSLENSGHLSTHNPPKMPSENVPGHLSASAANEGDDGLSTAPVSPKMPSQEKEGALALRGEVPSGQIELVG